MNRDWFISFAASLVPAIFLIAASYAGCDEVFVVTFFTLSIAAQGFNLAGTILNLFDLAPNYVGPLAGIVNSFATIAGMIAPYIVGLLTPNVCSHWKFIDVSRRILTFLCNFVLLK